MYIYIYIDILIYWYIDILIYDLNNAKKANENTIWNQQNDKISNSNQAQAL